MRTSNKKKRIRIKKLGINDIGARTYEDLAVEALVELEKWWIREFIDQASVVLAELSKLEKLAR